MALPLTILSLKSPLGNRATTTVGHVVDRFNHATDLPFSGFPLFDRDYGNSFPNSEYFKEKFCNEIIWLHFSGFSFRYLSASATILRPGHVCGVHVTRVA